MSGSGKTTYLLRYLEHSGHHRVFIFDHKLETQARLGIPACFSTEEMVEKVKKGEKFISYHHAEEYPGLSDNAFAFFSEWVFEVCKALCEDGKKSLFVCDEVNRFTGNQNMVWEFGQTIEDGRLQGLDFIGTSHAANQIHNRLRLQLSEIVALRSKDVLPLKFLEENGFNADEIRNLQTGEFITKNLTDDSFKKGKLFSCAGKAPRAKPQKTEDNSNPETKENALPKTSANPEPVQRNPRTREHGLL